MFSFSFALTVSFSSISHIKGAIMSLSRVSPLIIINCLRERQAMLILDVCLQLISLILSLLSVLHISSLLNVWLCSGTKLDFLHDKHSDVVYLLYGHLYVKQHQMDRICLIFVICVICLCQKKPFLLDCDWRMLQDSPTTWGNQVFCRESLCRSPLQTGQLTISVLFCLNCSFATLTFDGRPVRPSVIPECCHSLG